MNYRATARNGRVSIKVLTTDPTRISNKVNADTAEFIAGEVQKLAPQVERFYELKAQWATDDSVAEKMMEVRNEIINETHDIETAATRIQNG